ncbi:MAG TPA: tetratricopeptide repeat protein [bacterium]|nr:tetratricopeptide repeat protein [bacterium]
MSSNETGTKGTPQARPSGKVKFSDHLNDFLLANRKIFLIFGIVAVVLVVGAGVVSVVNSSIATNSTIALEKLEADFASWSSATDADKPAKSEAILTGADTIIRKYSGRYAAARSLLIKAQLQVAISDLPAAEKSFALLADKYPKSHMAPVALANAAAVAEDRGDQDGALKYLEKADSKYPTEPGSGRVILSIGRIHENMKQYDKAMEAYNRLVATGTDSDWTKLAHDRIIILKSLGLVH